MRESFDIGRWFDNPDELLVISGPCSVESREQLLATAEGLYATGRVHVLRGGIWKPRTRPDSFEGVGEDGLSWMIEARERFGMPVMIEVALPEHVELALRYGVDVLWVGARTVVNPFSVQELANCLKGIDIPVFVKNPVAPDVCLWLGAFERFASAGIRRLGGIHRGFSSIDNSPYRNAPLWEIPIELHRLRPDIPIVTDISHICGRRDLLHEVAQKAVNVTTDGFMIETHCNPYSALTDANQQITPSDMRDLLDGIVRRTKNSVTNEEYLQRLRDEIDTIDDELLALIAKRMIVSEKIGEFKKKQNMAVLQMDRWKNLLMDRIVKAGSLGLNGESVKEIFDIIHKDSIERQF
ncbi:MAG: chorismate mutase [Candidatus Limimorpha sp.]